MANILIVDDQAPLRNLISSTLARAGHTVVEVGSGKEAATKLATAKFDLLITDIIMPDENGLEIIMKLRRNNRSLPVVAMTGNAKSELLLGLAEDLGAWRMLTKPFTYEKLMETVNTALLTANIDSSGRQ